MHPNEWLDLVARHTNEPSTITEEELAQLRTNYTVWKSALEFQASESKNRQFFGFKKILGDRRIDPEAWNAFINNGETITALDEETMGVLRTLRETQQSEFNLGMTAKNHVKFLEKFDQEFECINGVQPAEIQEILWRTKAERFQKAIEAHRHAYVLANKAPNGLDFALWAEADLDEFHPSSHAQMTQHGRIAFKE